MAAAKAGFIYFAIVFIAGFLLGALRVTALEPLLGKTPAVMIEVPFVLAASWIVCQKVIVYFSVRRRLATRLTMGGVALGFLLLAEVGVSVLLFGHTLTAHLGNYWTTAGKIGLSGQLVYALFPAAQLRRLH